MCDLLLVAYVALNRHDRPHALAATHFLGELTRAVLKPLLITASNHDISTQGYQLLGKCPANATGAASDH